MAMSESEATMLLLGGDPWMRWDLWASRAWEMAAKATEIAISNGPAMNSEDNVDGRAMALFCAAELAKELAGTVNPLIAVAGLEVEQSVEMTALSPDMIDELLSGEDE